MVCPLTAVSKPAPDWNGTAVVNRDFVELKLTDFKGITTQMNMYIFFDASYVPLSVRLGPDNHREVLGFLFLSTRLVSPTPPLRALKPCFVSFKNSVSSSSTSLNRTYIITTALSYVLPSC